MVIYMGMFQAVCKLITPLELYWELLNPIALKKAKTLWSFGFLSAIGLKRQFEFEEPLNSPFLIARYKGMDR